MGIKIDVREFQEILRLTPPRQNLMIVGKHGIGKSQIINAHYQKTGKKVVPFFLGQMSDPGDLIGLMHKNPATGRSEFLPPWWWPADNAPIILFLDELNRARPEILQAVMDLTLSRTLAGKKLPAESIVIAAVNEGEEYQLTDLDPALMSRFNIYHFNPSVQDWLVWADKKDLDKRVTNFIQRHPTYLDSDGTKELYEGFSNSLSNTPDRRAWERVADLIQPLQELDELALKMIAGIVGLQAAALFRKNLATFLSVTPEQILLQFAKYAPKLKKLKLQELLFLNEQIVLWINGQHFQDNQKYTVVTNTGKYLQALKKGKKNEALAHFASMLEDPTFAKVSALVMVESPVVLAVLEEYIGSIAL